MYSVLAAMGLLDHGIKSPLGEPQHFTQKNVTKQDYKLSQWVWTKVLVSQKWSLPVPQSTAPTPSPHGINAMYCARGILDVRLVLSRVF